MSKLFSFCYNLHTLKRNGSLIYCSSCNKIIGSLNSNSCKDFHLEIQCSCGTHSCLHLSHSENTLNMNGSHSPDYRNGVYVCQKCREPVFSVAENRIISYSFSAVCRCGEVYNNHIHCESRLAETVNLIKNF